MDPPIPPLALICAGPSTALTRKSRNNALVLGSSSAPMTGRTLNAVYSYLGEHLEKQANRAAYRLGLGPNILAARIRDYFARGEQRESFLDELRSPHSSSIVLELEKDCKALINTHFRTNLPQPRSRHSRA
ncbi:hypothetical protein B0H17DRAFT_123620 [Mycena rosella]|uniref:Uncharacterized protein n=1 Tax=Mycena rosella TaxID=1033263 RepID=A0AAD7F5G3_MYCRO|nr:hypothetical protein B0H17DRAFT_123620 [Mycena rosella]